MRYVRLGSPAESAVARQIVEYKAQEPRPQPEKEAFQAAQNAIVPAIMLGIVGLIGYVAYRNARAGVPMF